MTRTMRCGYSGEVRWWTAIKVPKRKSCQFKDSVFGDSKLAGVLQERCDMVMALLTEGQWGSMVL